MELSKNNLFKDTNMIAGDMFWDGLIQVFSKKTGKYLGYCWPGQQELFEEPEEIEEPQTEAKNKAQLTLF